MLMLARDGSASDWLSFVAYWLLILLFSPSIHLMLGRWTSNRKVAGSSPGLGDDKVDQG